MATRLCFEELNVDRVFEAENHPYDRLYADTRAEIEEQQRAEETTEDTTEETAEEAPVEAPEGSDATGEGDGTTEPGMEALGVISLESALLLHQESQRLMISTEAVFTKENFQDAAGWTGQQLKRAGSYALDLTKQYGPVLLKHVYKGIVYAIQKSLKGLVVGTEYLAGKVHDYLTSYERFENQIQEAQKVLKLLKEQQKKPKEPGSYHEAQVIDRLSIKGSNNVLDNVMIAKKFFDSFQKQFINHTKQHVILTNKLIEGVIHEQTSAPTNYMTEDVSFDGFVPHVHPNYRPSTDLVESYAYRNVLPGDLCFLGYVPKKGLTNKVEIAEAYRNSRMFFGLNFQTKEPVEAIPYMSLDDLSRFLEVLLSICETGKEVKQDFETVARYRKGIQWQLKGYMKYLLQAKEKISIQESMAEYISVKTQLLDKVFVAGSVSVHDYIVRLLTASMSFVQASLEDAK